MQQHRQRRLHPKLHQIRSDPLLKVICYCARAARWLVARSRDLFFREYRLLLCVACASVVVSLSSAQAPPASGDVAEFIVNFARYTAWPPDPSRKSVAICYAHGGALAPTALALDQAATVRGLSVTWRQVTLPAQMPGCDVAWLSADVRPAPREWLQGISDKPVLTISNYADFTADGGIVGAYRVGSDWRFEINLEALLRARINIAAAALRLSQKPKTSVFGELR